MSHSHIRGTLVLLTAGLLYCALEWGAGAKLGGGRIFAATRESDQAEFQQMTQALSAAVARRCGADARRILFLNSDVTMPYLDLRNDRIGGCEAVHETVVTLFTSADYAGCNFILVQEFSPPVADADLNMGGGGWDELARWTAPSGRFGFALDRRRCGVKP